MKLEGCTWELKLKTKISWGQEYVEYSGIGNYPCSAKMLHGVL
jgi:hypothetical protein